METSISRQPSTLPKNFKTLDIVDTFKAKTLKMVCYTEQQHTLTLTEVEREKNEKHMKLNGYKHAISGKNGGFVEEKPSPRIPPRHELFEETPLLVAVITYIGYGVLVVIGYFRDFLRKYGLEETRLAKEKFREVGAAVIYVVCSAQFLK